MHGSGQGSGDGPGRGSGQRGSGDGGSGERGSGKRGSGRSGSDSGGSGGRGAGGRSGDGRGAGGRSRDGRGGDGRASGGQSGGQPADPSSRRVYLRSLPDPLVPGRHSSGARRRTAQLQRFLAPLEAAAREVLPVEGRVQLLVASSGDWRRLSSYPYGLPFARTSRQLVSLVVAADYPPRLTARFDALLLRAGQGGVRAPGDIREFLDLLLGHEWGHAAANRSGLRTRVKWFDELMATYLFVQGLRAVGDEGTLQRLRAWAALQTAATEGQRGALDGFEYPRGTMRLARMLWYQGVFTERALALAEARGWAFPEALAGRLPVSDRGALARTLIELEPGFRPWFAVFAPEEEDRPAVGEGPEGTVQGSEPAA